MSEVGLTERLLRRDRSLLIFMIAILFVLAGLYTVYGVGMRMTALQMTSMRGMRDMSGPRSPGDWTLGYAVLVVLMWWVMMIAMMLPSVAPTVLLHSTLLRRGANAANVPAISGCFLAGYLVIWCVFSLAAAATQFVLETAGIVSANMMILIDTLPGGLVLITAGLFQFTPLKQACLSHCQSPARFLTERRRRGLWGAFTMGLEHGTYCLGCCWLLMALLFVGGIMNLYWIVGLAAFVVFEKLTRYGNIASKFAGAALMIWGSWVAISAL
jgi:predicted metal-binding membrane protein